MALKSSDGSVWTWGLSTSGQLGENVSGNRSSPVSVVGAHSFSAISGGTDFALALKSSDASVWTWGIGTSGQLGDNTTTQRVVQGPVANVADASRIALGQVFACVRRADRNVSCWGGNGSGQVGDGSVTNRPVPSGSVFGVPASAGCTATA